MHQPEVRSDVRRLGTLLHDAFIEIGRSGQFYSRNQVLEALPKEESGISVWAQDFTAEEISDELVLLIYKSAHINSDGELSRHSLRSSLWQQTPHGWQIRFHQGTPTDTFVQQEIGVNETRHKRKPMG